MSVIGKEDKYYIACPEECYQHNATVISGHVDEPRVHLVTVDTLFEIILPLISNPRYYNETLKKDLGAVLSVGGDHYKIPTSDGKSINVIEVLSGKVNTLYKLMEYKSLTKARILCMDYQKDMLDKSQFEMLVLERGDNFE